MTAITMLALASRICFFRFQITIPGVLIPLDPNNVYTAVTICAAMQERNGTLAMTFDIK